MTHATEPPIQSPRILKKCYFLHQNTDLLRRTKLSISLGTGFPRPVELDDQNFLRTPLNQPPAQKSNPQNT